MVRIKLIYFIFINTMVDLLINSSILDKDDDCLVYEGLGTWTEMMESPDGRKLFRNWNFFDRSNRREITIKYPLSWKQYFARPDYYPRTPLGKYFDLDISK